MLLFRLLSIPLLLGLAAPLASPRPASAAQGPAGSAADSLVAAPFHDGVERAVLHLSSYHSGFAWSDSILVGLREALGESDIPYELYVEYLDAKRHPEIPGQGELLGFLRRKYGGQPLDLIVTADDYAFFYAATHRDELAPGAPIVFCGLNASPDSVLAVMDDITGVVEEIDLRGTLDVALRLRPGAREITVVYDSTVTNFANRRRIGALASDYAGRVAFDFREVADVQECANILPEIPPESIVLLLALSRDRDGCFLDFRESLERIRPAARAPIFSFWNFYVGWGVVGGSLVNGADQGRIAGHLATRILAGEMAGDIPVVRRPPWRYIFDHKELELLGVSESALPEGSVVVNRPVSYFEEHRKVLLPGAGLLVFLSLVILVLGRNILQRRAAERELRAERRRLRSSLERQTLLADVAARLNALGALREAVGPLLPELERRLNVAGITICGLEDCAPDEAEAAGADAGGVRMLREYCCELRDYFAEREQQGALVVDALSSTSEVPTVVRSFLRERKVAAIVAVPLVVLGRMRGIAIFSQGVRHHWRRDEVNIFTTLAAMFANAWERDVQASGRVEAERKHTRAIQALEHSSRAASLGVMAAGITHEINQPLNVIRMTTDRAILWGRRNPEALPERIVEHLRRIGEGAARIDAIIRHMRSFRSGLPQPDLEAVDLNEAVLGACGLMERELQSRGVECLRELAPGTLSVAGRELQLEQITINLVSNAAVALEANPAEDRRIRIVTRRDDGAIWLEVHDNGPGLPEEQDASLYDAFFTTRQAGEGTGLGLAIVKQFVDGFGGEIFHGTNEDGGASFRLKLRPAETTEEQA